MENEKSMEMFAKIYENMTDDQKKRALECATSEDFMAIVENEGVEMPDDMFDDVAGGAAVLNSNKYNASVQNSARINQATYNQATQNANKLNLSMTNASMANQATYNQAMSNQSMTNSSKINQSTLNKAVPFGTDLASFLTGK